MHGGLSCCRYCCCQVALFVTWTFLDRSGKQLGQLRMRSAVCPPGHAPCCPTASAAPTPCQPRPVGCPGSSRLLAGLLRMVLWGNRTVLYWGCWGLVLGVLGYALRRLITQDCPTSLPVSTPATQLPAPPEAHLVLGSAAGAPTWTPCICWPSKTL